MLALYLHSTPYINMLFLKNAIHTAGVAIFQRKQYGTNGEFCIKRSLPGVICLPILDDIAGLLFFDFQIVIMGDPSWNLFSDSETLRDRFLLPDKSSQIGVIPQDRDVWQPYIQPKFFLIEHPVYFEIL